MLSPWTKLPTSVAVDIWLVAGNNARTFARLECVCSQWRAVCKTPTVERLWRAMYLRDWEVDSSEDDCIARIQETEETAPWKIRYMQRTIVEHRWSARQPRIQWPVRPPANNARFLTCNHRLAVFETLERDGANQLSAVDIAAGGHRVVWRAKAGESPSWRTETNLRAAIDRTSRLVVYTETS